MSTSTHLGLASLLVLCGCETFSEGAGTGATDSSTTTGDASASGPNTSDDSLSTTAGSASASSGSPTSSSATTDPTSTTDPTHETAPGSTSDTTDASGTTDGLTTTGEPGTTGGSSTGSEKTCENSSECDDANFCNGPEACDPMTSSSADGCVAGTPPCVGAEYCAEDRDECITSRRIFISSETFQGDLGGALAADATCQSLADSASLPGSWRAYLIDSANGLDRHTQLPVPYVRTDNVGIADDWADLSDESIQNPIERDENADSAGGNVWTGLINVGGSPAGNNDCSDWTSNVGGCLGSSDVCGGAGESSQTDNHWDGYFIFQCSDQYRLYCVEQ